MDWLLQLLGRPQCCVTYYPWRWSMTGFYCVRPRGHFGKHRDNNECEFTEPFDRRDPKALAIFERTRSKRFSQEVIKP